MAANSSSELLQRASVTPGWRPEAFAKGFHRFRSPAESQASGRSSLLLFCHLDRDILLRHVRLGQTNRKLANTGNHSHAFRYRNGPASIKQIEQMRALQAKLISGQQGETLFFRSGCILVIQERLK